MTDFLEIFQSAINLFNSFSPFVVFGVSILNAFERFLQMGLLESLIIGHNHHLDELRK